MNNPSIPPKPKPIQITYAKGLDETPCSSFCHPEEPCSITGDGRCGTIAKLTAERDWMAHLLATIRDKADIRFGIHRGLLAFSDLKDEAAKSMTNVERIHADD